jgi:hypothetical protein
VKKYPHLIEQAPDMVSVNMDPSLAWERTELRARAFMVDKTRGNATVWLLSRSEKRAFVAKVSDEDAKTFVLGIGGGCEFDVCLRIGRDEDRRIGHADVIEVVIVPDMPPEEQIQAWRKWFEENAAEWNDVSDVLKGLMREALP